tara:strand:+ start:4808 stop:5218 length:411 start_codon:yes stop_codon:yes gene_type:complete
MGVRGLNQWTIAGRLGADPEINSKPGGIPVCSMSVAVPGRMKDKEQQVEWTKVTVFGKTAENCAKYLCKGKEVIISGRAQTDKWVAKDGTNRYSTKLIAHNVQWMGSGKDKPEEQQSRGHENAEAFDFEDEHAAIF